MPLKLALYHGAPQVPQLSPTAGNWAEDGVVLHFFTLLPACYALRWQFYVWQMHRSNQIKSKIVAKPNHVIAKPNIKKSNQTFGIM